MSLIKPVKPRKPNKNNYIYSKNKETITKSFSSYACLQDLLDLAPKEIDPKNVYLDISASHSYYDTIDIFPELSYDRIFPKEEILKMQEGLDLKYEVDMKVYEEKLLKYKDDMKEFKKNEKPLLEKEIKELKDKLSLLQDKKTKLEKK